MTGPTRGTLPGLLALSLVAAATTCAAMLSWAGFVEISAPYVLPLVALGVVVAGTGTLTRWWRLPGTVVVSVQLIVSAMALSLFITGNPLPVGAGWTDLINGFTDAGRAAQEYASPVPGEVPGNGVYPLLIGGGLVCILLVDFFACTLRRVPLAGLPLLTVYSLPVSMLGDGISWWIFAATAIGFLALLYLHETEQINRWGHSLNTGSHPASGVPTSTATGFSVRAGAARSNAWFIGGAATTLAVIVPVAIPTMTLSVFDFGAGNGGDNSITVDNPIADLRRDLRREVDIPLLQIRTDDPRPEYLRISVLNRFRDTEWSSGDRQVPTANVPNGAMPALEGVSDTIERTSYSYDVSITEEFESTWLPTQAPVSSIEAPGDWRFDPRTMDFIASQDDLDTAGLSYSMTGVDLELRGDALAQARTSTVGVSEEYTELPAGTPDLVRDLALEVTRDAGNRYDRAVTLQNWFRDNFEYSIEDAQAANGVDALEQFLSPSGRVGYCEQFAASMAVMARSLGIPARVAVGFLRPDQIGSSDTWEYSAFDLHAWPELYFDGFGWVLFEPTPSDRQNSQAPSYTRNRDVDAPAPVAPTERPETGGPQRDVPSPSAAPEPEVSDPNTTTPDRALPWTRILGVLGGLLMLAAVVFGPRSLRTRQRDRRLTDGIEGAWRELEATAVDLAVPWPRDRSPRETRDVLVGYFGAPEDHVAPERPARGPGLAPDAVIALDRLVAELEVLRYAETPPTSPGFFTAEVATCSDALRHGATPRVRRRARWLPASVTRPTRATSAHGVSQESTPVGAVEHMY